jgi:nitrogen PTS system EIIA component
MKITEILSQEMVLPNLQGNTKPEILHELAQSFTSQFASLNPDTVVGVLAERERLGSTAIGDGIAIPHGKIRGVNRIVGAFGRNPKGVDFDSLDGNPTHLFFVLVAPEESTSLHLKALARVSRLFRDTAFRERLETASTAEELYNLIVEEDSRY